MPFVLSYQDAPSKPEFGGVTIMTLLVRWGPRAGRKPHRLVAKSGSEKKSAEGLLGRPRGGCCRRSVNQTPKTRPGPRSAGKANQYPEAGFSFPMKTPFRSVF